MGNCILTKGKENLQMDLLWTNPNPLAAFGAQTLSLDLSDYSTLLIIHTGYCGGSSAVTGVFTTMVKVNYSTPQCLLAIDAINNRAQGMSRTVKPTDSGIVFANSNDGRDCIPYQIWGIKQFKFIQKYVSGLQGIDVTNILHNSVANAITYVATQDCYAICNGYNAAAQIAHIKINNVELVHATYTDSVGTFAGPIPLKQGDTIYLSNSGTSEARLTIYGIR